MAVSVNATIKTLTNVGDPIILQDGTPVADMKVTFQLVVFGSNKVTSVVDRITGEVIASTPSKVSTNVNGEFTVGLWPNNRGDALTAYQVTFGKNVSPFYIYVNELLDNKLSTAKHAFQQVDIVAFSLPQIQLFLSHCTTSIDGVPLWNGSPWIGTGQSSDPLYMYQQYGVGPTILGAYSEDLVTWDTPTQARINAFIALGIPIEAILVAVTSGGSPTSVVYANDLNATTLCEAGSFTGEIGTVNLTTLTQLEVAQLFLVGSIQVNNMSTVTSLVSGLLTGLLESFVLSNITATETAELVGVLTSSILGTLTQLTEPTLTGSLVSDSLSGATALSVGSLNTGSDVTADNLSTATTLAVSTLIGALEALGLSSVTTLDIANSTGVLSAAAMSSSNSLAVPTLTGSLLEDALSSSTSISVATLALSDTTAPTVTAFTITNKSPGSMTVTINAFTATDAVGVTGYLITESTTAPSAGAAGWSATPIASFTASGTGITALYAWAKDAAGNVSSYASQTELIFVATPYTQNFDGATVGATSYDDWSIIADSDNQTAAISNTYSTTNQGTTGRSVKLTQNGSSAEGMWASFYRNMAIRSSGTISLKVRASIIDYGVNVAIDGNIIGATAATTTAVFETFTFTAPSGLTGTQQINIYIDDSAEVYFAVYVDEISIEVP